MRTVWTLNVCLLIGVVKFCIFPVLICVHLIGLLWLRQFKTGKVKYGKTVINFFLITSDITGVALMTLEAASKEAYWLNWFPSLPQFPTVIRPELWQWLVEVSCLKIKYLVWSYEKFFGRLSQFDQRGSYTKLLRRTMRYFCQVQIIIRVKWEM